MNVRNIKSRLDYQKVLPIGRRGTSYEMVVRLFKTGVLTGNPTQAKRRGGNYIYFWPIRENWQANGLTPPVPWGKNYWDSDKWSQSFALSSSHRDYFKGVMSFSIDEYYQTRCGFEDISKRVKEAMSDRGLNDSDIAHLIRETEMRRGYMLEFHPDLARDYKMEEDSWFGSNHCVAFQVNCPEGLPLRYISKISPIGEWDKRLLLAYLKREKVCTSQSPRINSALSQLNIEGFS